MHASRFLTLALAGALATLLSGCNLFATPEQLDQVIHSMKTALPSELAQRTFEQPLAFSDDLAPTLVYEGAGATIVAIAEPRRDERVLATVELQVLARTARGSYFLFTDRSWVQTPSGDSLALIGPNRPCVHPTCRDIRDFQPLSTQGAKAWFFHSAHYSPERYKALFGEEPPAQRISM